MTSSSVGEHFSRELRTNLEASYRGGQAVGSVASVTNPGEDMTAQQRAAATQGWEPADCEQPCPCGTRDCGHGEPCADDDCDGHDVHTMRNPTTSTDVTAWQDSLECCQGCGAYSQNVSLPGQPWGTLSADGPIVFDGVVHYELGV